MKVLYLKGLNGLRAIAALAVLVSHIMKVYGSKGLDLAGFGVTIFFSLSGFLITYLLIKEREKTNTISIKKFYIRRILRIWPLYYFFASLVLLASYFIFHEQLSISQIFYYVFFLPNVPFIIGGSINMLMHYWSLGVEEQFYLFWPFVTKKFFSKFLPFVLTFIVLFLLLKVYFNLYFGGYSIPYTFIYACRFDCMAIGGLGAYLYHFRNESLKLINSTIVQLIAWTVIGLVFFNSFHIFSIIDHEIIAIVTVILIINQISNPKNLISLENKVFDYLGRISFGIYVYHPLIIALVLYFFQVMGIINKGMINSILFSCVVIVITLLTAHISYKYFESWFLTIKHKYAIVKSSSSARETFSTNAIISIEEKVA